MDQGPNNLDQVFKLPELNSNQKNFTFSRQKQLLPITRIRAPLQQNEYQVTKLRCSSIAAFPFKWINQINVEDEERWRATLAL